MESGYLSVTQKTTCTFHAAEIQWVKTNLVIKTPEEVFLYFACTPALVASGFAVLNPVQQPMGTLTLGIWNTAPSTHVLPSGTIGPIFVWIMPSLSIQGPEQFYFSGAKEWYQPPTEPGPISAEVIAAEANQAVTIAIPGEQHWR